MRALTVLDPGLQSTIQDLGRPGHGRLGVSAAGAADALSLRAANLLAGNPGNSAAIEMTLVGGAFRFECDALFALAGSDFGARLDDDPVPPWVSRRARAGQVLLLGASRGGARACLALHGGFEVPRVFGSASTHLPSGIGGLGGRALRRGDTLPLGEGPGAAARRVDPRHLPLFAPGSTLRVTDGPGSASFAPASRESFFGGTYIVEESSNRMGLRLCGPALAPPHGGEMISEGMPLGAVQVPPGGQPVVLFVDHQTTGGYPVIASVVSADLFRVGQIRPRDAVRFERVPLDAARALLREQEEILRPEVLFAP